MDRMRAADTGIEEKSLVALMFACARRLLALCAAYACAEKRVLNVYDIGI
jgi:hypothetical protein